MIWNCKSVTGTVQKCCTYLYLGFNYSGKDKIKSKKVTLLRKLKDILEGQKIKSVATLHPQREIRGVEGLLKHL